jgi:hypothetical protein
MKAGQRGRKTKKDRKEKGTKIKKAGQKGRKTKGARKRNE